MAKNLVGRLAVITGASAGIGSATAKELAALGCSLLLGARRLDKLEALKKEIVAAHPAARITVAAMDVTDPMSCASFARTAHSVGHAEILINNAGLARGVASIAAADEADWREMIDTNLLGLLRITRLFLPGMLTRKSGTIVNLGSVAGLEPYLPF